MKPDIKAQWLAALRSGAYRQGHHTLHENNTFCCLGVLCDLAAQAGVGLWDGDEFVVKAGDTVMEVDTQVPSRAVAVWAELEARNPLIDQDDETSDDLRLAMFNDGSVGHDLRPHTFAEIADLIEAYL